MIDYERSRQDKIDAARKSAFADPNMANGMRALGGAGDVAGVNAMAGMGNYQTSQATNATARAQEMLKVLGPLATRLKKIDPQRLPEVYAGVAQQVHGMFPEAGVPLQYGPDVPGLLESVEQMWQSQQQALTPTMDLTETPEGFAYMAKTIPTGSEPPKPIKVEGFDSSKSLKNQQKALDDAKKMKSEKFDNAGKLRAEYIKSSGEFVKVRDAFGRIKASADDPSAAGDLSLIFNYMKVLDPGSTVREGEFANAQNAGSVPDRVYNVFNKVLSGERLAPEQRKDFLDRSNKLYGTAERINGQLKNEYTRLAKRNDLDPEDVIVEYNIGAEPQASPDYVPKDGDTITNPTTKERMVFKNGAWEKM
jgi:hypothetical protein